MSQRHLPALDGIRGLAVLWVIAHNTTDQLGAPDSGPFHLLALLLHPGWIGVQIFFALSGFLITGGLLDTQKASNYLGSFYARRALRIVPLYFLVLFSLLVLMPALVEIPARLQSTVQHQPWLWLFVSNWAPTGITGDFYGFGHFWSLAIEEQFYLLWPLVVFRQTPRRLFMICVAIASASIAARCAAAFAGVDPETIYDNTLLRMDSLALGAAGAALVRIPEWASWLRQRLLPLAVGSCMVFLAGIAMTRGYDVQSLAGITLGYPILAITSALWVTGTALVNDARAPANRLVSWQALRSCGKYSYAMYVLHMPIHKLVGTPILAPLHGTRSAPALVVCYAIAVGVVTYLLAVVSWYCVEKPALRLKRYFKPRPLPN